ncbi:hypothetical protein SARC_09591 [Sphaeroforma arctica JP610]|uniref:Uncharacterized protein n=1 Tax=Sphaeroforma arctica JP610 TaxID=667725 RepID=A0A0L0FN94_9EUKA|nr:hypothetical protein SARC_09591 [Sphaeroforma arctica JP610]KNC77961.1 hypothetical protein SARC_09591 [Sphaeroforma arctica JP610]|eukprot:XP_014151863.1 hypothetical protein SARC_09591 [Sphaeroforma arctica JP610]
MNDAPDSSSRDCLVPLPPGPTAVTITDDNENLWSFQLHITQLRRMYKQAIAAQKITAPASPNTPKASQTVVGEQADDTEEKITSLATDPCCHDNDGRAGGERHTLALRPCGSIDSTSMPALPSNRMANGIDKKRESFTSNASTIGPTTDNPSTTREGRPPRPSSIDLNKHRADKTAEYSDEVPASPKTRNKRGWHAFFGRSKKQGHKNSVPGTTSQQMSQLSLATSIPQQRTLCIIQALHSILTHTASKPYFQPVTEPETKNTPDGQPSEPATTPQKEVLDDTPIRRFKSMESVFRVSKQNKVFPNTGMNTGTQVQEGCQAAHRQQGNKVSGFGVNGKQRLSVSSDAIDNLELQTRTQTRALADTLALANAHSALSEDKDALQFKGRGSVTAGTNTNMNALGRRATKRLLNRKKSVKVRYADQETNKVALTATVSVQMSATVHFATSQATDTAHPLSVSTLQLNVDSAAPKSTLSTTQTHSPTPTTRVHSEFPSGRRLVRNSIASLCPGQLEKQSGYADEAFFDNPVYTPARRKRSDAQTHTRVYSPPTGNLHPASHANSARNMHTRRETNTRVQAPSSGPRYPLSNCLHAVADPKHRRGNSSRVCAQARSPDKAPVDHRRIEGTVLDEPQMQGMDRLKSRAKSMYSRMNEGEYAAAWTASRYSVGPAGGVGRRRSSESSVSTCEQECGSAEAADTLSWRVNPLQYERMVLVDDSGRPTHTPTPNASPWEPVHASANANSADRDRAHHALDTRFIALPSTDSSASTETVSSQGKASRMSLSMSPPSVRRESVRSVLVDPICLSGDEASDADSADAADAERREGHGYEQAQQTYEDQCGEQPGEHSLQDARALEGAGLDRVRDSETGDADLNATNSEARGIWTNAGQPTRGTGTGVHGDDREMRRNTVNAGAYDESGSESRRVVSDCAQGMAETECRESVAPTPVTPRVIHRDVLDSYVPDNEHGKVSDSLHKANTHSTDNRLVCDVGRGMHNTLDDMPHAPVGKAFSFGSESLMARKDSRGSDNTLDSASRSRDVSITGSRTISLSSASALNNIHSRTSGNSLRASLTNNSRSSTSSSIADKLKHSPDVVGKVTRARSFFECLPTTVSPNPSVLRRERDVQYKTYSHTRAVIESACEDESLILKHRRRTDEDLRSGSGAHSSVRTRVRSYAQPPGETNIARKGSAFTGSGSGVEASLAQAISERQLELLSLSEMVLYSAQTGPSQPPLTQTEATAKMRALMHTQATAIDTLVGLLSQGSA